MLEQAAIDVMICEVAAEFGITAEALRAEIDDIEQHYAAHGTYPPDIEEVRGFYARHGRWPDTEAELDACLRAAGWDL
jgi:hypothetical protein